MSFLQVLNDPNVQKFVTPLCIGVFAIFSGWLINQLPQLRNLRQGWRMVGIAIKVLVLTVVFPSWPDAMGAFSSGADETKQLASFAYGVMLLFLVGSVGIDLYQLFRKPTASNAADPELARKRKFRETLMDKVEQKWFGLAQHPVYRQAQMDLGLEVRPDLLCFEVQRAREPRRMLPPGRKLIDEFRALGAGGALLILGEAGAGKTTQLIELAIALKAETDARNLEHPLPVVLNISSWGKGWKKGRSLPSLEEWLLAEMVATYTVRREAGLAWLQEDDLVLLLDGLDEVAAARRNECVAAINQFQRQHGSVPIVLCSRIADFEALETELEHFQTAVMIQPLAEAQVDDYLQRAGLPLAEVRSVLMDGATDDDETRQAKAELRELARKPLFLWILALAYRGRSPAELLAVTDAERQSLLFQKYVEQMFLQRPLDKQQQWQMEKWLRILARQMGAEKEFLIEQMQPIDWLRRGKWKWQYRLIGGLIFGLLGGLIGGLANVVLVGLDKVDLVERLEISMSHEVRREILKALKEQLIFGLIGGLIFGLIGGLIFGLIGGLIFGLIGGLIVELIVGLIFGLIVGLIFGLIVGLIFG
jgi:hypothetical protein